MPAQSLVLGEECERAKPHPDPYLVGAKNIGVALDEVFAVEDSPSGAPATALLLCLFRTAKGEGQREIGPVRGCEVDRDTRRQGVRLLSQPVSRQTDQADPALGADPRFGGIQGRGTCMCSAWRRNCWQCAGQSYKRGTRHQ